MDTFGTCLTGQSARHPAMRPQDAVKLCYQAAFGAEHLVGDGAAARRALQTELAAVAADGAQPLAEPVCADLCRLNLAAWKARVLPPEWLFRMFEQASAGFHDGRTVFEDYLQTAGRLAAEGRLPFPAGEWETWLARYRREGVRPVHHSPAYREAERPAYRLVPAAYVRLLPLMERLAALPEGTGARVAAIDGRAASGKTTAAGQLAAVLGAGVIHMDDFFLPPGLRTAERLARPGGNVHAERFLREVLPCLSGGEAFSYRRFDCERMAYGEAALIPAGSWRIVEGAYSCHPAFGAYMGIRVFSDIAPAEQMRRIRRRDGEEAAAVFAARWIPMEEAYIRAFGIREKADVVI